MGPTRGPVRSFFDRLAPTYRLRYEGKQVFLKYLFTDRVEKALEGWVPDGKTILDIGAGTGILYDRLPPGQDYYACDISEAMLAHSDIPPNRRWTGAPAECDFPVSLFDAIFVLGVTAYLSEQEWDDMAGFIAQRLAPEGRAVVSFTNLSSIDYKIRRTLSPFLPLGMKKEKLIGQAFAPMAYTGEKVLKNLPQGLYLQKFIWLNASVFPFSRLFPRISVWLSRRLLKYALPNWLARRLFSDFMVVLSRQ